MSEATNKNHATYKEPCPTTDKSEQLVAVLHMINVWSHTYFTPWQGAYSTSTKEV
jgi:hypothetical protein